MCARMVFVAMSSLLSFPFVFAVSASERTWDGGGGDPYWSTAMNWDGDTAAPSAGDALFFGASSRLAATNNLAEGIAFSGITFLSGAGAYTLGGNGITLDGDISNLSVSAKTVGLPLTLSGTRTIFGSNAAVTVSGVLSGPGGLNTCVTNTLTLSGNNTYEGFTTVSNSILLVTHSSALGSTNAGTRVFSNTDATLKLSGSVVIDEPLFFKGDKPVPVQYSSSLISDTGTNTIRNLITKEGNLRIRTESGAKTLILAGGVLHVSGGNLGFNPQSGSTIIVTNKPLQLGTATIQSEYSGTVVLAVPGNTYGGLLIVDHHKFRTDVADALCPTAVLTVGGSWVADALLDMNGFDQTTTLLKSDNFSTPGYRAVTSAVPATLTLNQSANSVYGGALVGAVSLVKNGGGSFMISNAVSTTTGDITVNAGTFLVAENASFSAAKRFRINGGMLELRNGASLPDDSFLVVAAGAKVRLASGITETVGRLYLDGEPQTGGTWGSSTSGAEHTSDTYFSGDGKLSVADGPTGSTSFRWDGGGSDLNMSTAANWDGDAVPGSDGYATASFAAAGASAVADASFAFNRLIFNADSDFAVAAGAGVITNGIGGLLAAVPSATSRTYTFESGLVFSEDQFWSVTNSGVGVTTVAVTGAIADDGQGRDLTLSGNGVLSLAGDNTYSGKTTIKTNACLVVKHANALGGTAGNTVIENGGYIRIDGPTGGGLTISEPITMTGDEALGWAGTIRSNTGSNILSGKITSNSARLRCEAGANLEVKGGVDGSALVCTASGNRGILFTEKPITAGSLTCHSYDGGIILAVAGNTFSTFTACGFFNRTDVPNAWSPTLSLTQGDGSHGYSVLNLNGNDQTVGLWRSGRDNADPRILCSVTPATFTVSQNSDTLFNGTITGAVSIVKLGTGNLMLTNAFITTSGGFTVSNGTLTVANKGTFGSNSTNIVVGGTGTLLLSNAVAIADSAVVTMPADGVNTAKINLAGGGEEKVGWLFYGNGMQRAGTYGATGSGAGHVDNTHFSGSGTLRVLHDNAGTLIAIQ